MPWPKRGDIGSGDVDHLELDELLYKGSERSLSFVVVHFELLAGSVHQFLKRDVLLFLDHPPHGSAGTIETVVQQCFKMQKDSSPIGQRGEDG